MHIMSSIRTAHLVQLISFLFALAALLGLVSGNIPSTRVALNDPGTLVCAVPCVGQTQWRRDGETVAQCGQDAPADLQFSCTAEEGCTLTVPQVNYSTRGFYSVYCDGSEIPHCRQLLQPLADESTFDLEAGQDLRINLHTPDPVVITVVTPQNSSPTQLCTVNGRVKQCCPDYQDRVQVLDNTFILMAVMPSDRGSYTVKEKEGITTSISNVTIKGSWLSFKPRTAIQAGYTALAFAVGFFAGILVLVLPCYRCFKEENIVQTIIEYS